MSHTITPVPWTYDKETHGITARDHFDLVATVQYNNFGTTEANGFLLTAAPDLMDALHRALPFVEDALEYDHMKKPEVRKIIKTIMAAIAKANGESA